MTFMIVIEESLGFGFWMLVGQKKQSGEVTELWEILMSFFLFAIL